MNIIANVRAQVPLIHCITNYVTVNDVANILLACGGSPIMADDAQEAAEMSSICNGTVINIGTLNARTVDSMITAGKKANELGHIVVLDPVGAGATTLRTETTFRLLNEIQFSVIRGNISEIKTAKNKKRAIQYSLILYQMAPVIISSRTDIKLTVPYLPFLSLHNSLAADFP